MTPRAELIERLEAAHRVYADPREDQTPKLCEALAVMNRLPAIIAALRDDGWRPIETAPVWVADNEALVGQLNSEGRWVKVFMWTAEWSRWSVVHRGATHYMKLPAPPTQKDADHG